MTSATERLRALLDERGVEYDDESYGRVLQTSWHGVARRKWRISEAWGKPLTEMQTLAMTPEQAVAESLEAGTCHIDLVGYNEREDRFQCRSCDWSMWFKRGTWPRFNYCPKCGKRVIG